MKRAHWIALLGIGILLCSVVFSPVSGDTRWIKTLHNSAHAPVFGCVALLTLVILRARPRFASFGPARQYGIALAIALTLGVLTELLQIPVGRDANVGDVLRDLIGAVAVLGLFAVVDEQVRMLPHALVVRCVAAAIGLVALAHVAAPVARSAIRYQQRDAQFPVLADFTERYDRYFVLQRFVEYSPARMPSQWASKAGEQAMHVQVLDGRYPGMEFIELPPDWSGYSTLAFDLTNPTSLELQFVLRVHDATHNQQLDDRFNRRLALPPRTRQVFRIPLKDIAAAPRSRVLDLRHVAGMVIFRTDDSPRVSELYFSRAWLE